MSAQTLSAESSEVTASHPSPQSSTITFHVLRFTFHVPRAFISITALTLLAFVLRRYHLGDESLWFDEADIVSRARQPASVLIGGFAQAGENGPIYTLLLHYWLALLDAIANLDRAVHALFGAGYEAPIRALSAIFGAAAIPPMYLLARRVGGHWVALLAAGLLAVNPFHIWHSQDAKMYSLLVLMTIVSTLLYVRAIEYNTLPLWAGYVLATWVMLTTHSMGVLVLLAQLITTRVLFKSEIRNPKSEMRLLRWGWAMLLILGPLFPIAWLRIAALVTDTVDVGGWYAPAGLHDILGTVLVSFAVNRADVWWELIGALTMVALALLGCWRLVTNRRVPNLDGEQPENPKSEIRNPKSRVAPLIIALWLLPILGLWLVTLRIELFQARYLIMALPAYFILVAVGLMWLRRLQPILLTIPLALLTLTTGAALAGVNYSSQAQKEDWRGAMVYVQDHARLRDGIVVFPGYLATAVNEYYKPGGPGRVPTIPIETVPSLRTQGFGENELNEYLDRISTCKERVWLVTSPTRQGQEDPQNRVQQWFQYNWHTFDTQEFNGVTLYGISFDEQLHCWYPPPDFPETHLFENGIQFSGYIYELRADATTQPDASFFPLTLYWRTNQKLTEDYLVSVRIKDAAGQVVKEEALGPLNGYRPTSQWPPDKDMIDYRDIRLPGGMTPGNYTVSLQLYPEGQLDKPLKLQGGGDEIVFAEPLRVVTWQP